MRKCLNCKIVELKSSQKNFCCKKCYNEYCKTHNLGFYNSQLQKVLGKKGGLKSMLTNKENKTSVYSPEIRAIGNKAGIIALRNKQSGPWFNPILNKQQRVLTLKTRYYFAHIIFPSKCECELAMCIHYQLEKLKDGNNVHVLINRKEVDFFIAQYKCFIELHSPLFHFDKNDTEQNYYLQRRQLLNMNGFKNYNLLIIK